MHMSEQRRGVLCVQTPLRASLEPRFSRAPPMLYVGRALPSHLLDARVRACGQHPTGGTVPPSPPTKHLSHSVTAGEFSAVWCCGCVPQFGITPTLTQAPQQPEQTDTTTAADPLTRLLDERVGVGGVAREWHVLVVLHPLRADGLDGGLLSPAAEVAHVVAGPVKRTGKGQAGVCGHRNTIMYVTGGGVPNCMPDACAGHGVGGPWVLRLLPSSSVPEPSEGRSMLSAQPSMTERVSPCFQRWRVNRA